MSSTEAFFANSRRIREESIKKRKENSHDCQNDFIKGKEKEGEIIQHYTGLKPYTQDYRFDAIDIITGRNVEIKCSSHWNKNTICLEEYSDMELQSLGGVSRAFEDDPNSFFLYFTYKEHNDGKSYSLHEGFLFETSALLKREEELVGKGRFFKPEPIKNFNNGNTFYTTVHIFDMGDVADLILWTQLFKDERKSIVLKAI